MVNNDWNDLFLRSDLRETGPEVRYGGLPSPDIISCGQTPVNPDQFATEESYQQCYDAPLRQNLYNYFYIRAKNSSQSSMKNGMAYLVLSNPAIIPWPGNYGWTEIKTCTGQSGSKIMDVAPGQIGVTREPFLYIPRDSGPRSVISWLSTPEHPLFSMPPRIDTIDQLVRFLIEHPSYSQHNINIMEDSEGWITTIRPYCQGAKESDIVFGIATQNCFQFKAQLSCDVPVKDGKYIQIPEFTVPTNDRYTYPLCVTVPADFEANIALSFTSTRAFPDPFSISLVTYFKMLPGNPMYESGMTASQLNFDPQVIKDDDARYYPFGSFSVTDK